MVDSQPPADYAKKVGDPFAFSDDELAEFAYLASTGGKVSMVSLPGRLRKAHLLATLRGAKGSLLATAC